MATMVAGIALALLGLQACASAPQEPQITPQSTGLFVVQDVEQPDAEFIALPRGDHLMVHAQTPAARAIQLPSPFTAPAMPWLDQRNEEVTLTWDDSKADRHVRIIKRFAPQKAPVWRMEQRARVVAAAGNTIAPCEDKRVSCVVLEKIEHCKYSGDLVQPFLAAGVSLGDLVPALTLQWNQLPRSQRLGFTSAGEVFRTSANNRSQIQELLRALAIDDSVAVEQRIFAVGALWMTTPPADREDLKGFDPDNTIVKSYLTTLLSGPISACEERYFASEP